MELPGILPGGLPLQQGGVSAEGGRGPGELTRALGGSRLQIGKKFPAEGFSRRPVIGIQENDLSGGAQPLVCGHDVLRQSGKLGAFILIA